MNVYMGILVDNFEMKRIKILASDMDEAKTILDEIATKSGKVVEDVLEV